MTVYRFEYRPNPLESFEEFFEGETEEEAIQIAWDVNMYSPYSVKVATDQYCFHTQEALYVSGEWAQMVLRL